MGIFGGGDEGNPAADRANALVEQQINMNKQELEAKRESLMQQRIAIVRSQGAQNWSPSSVPYEGGGGASKPSAVDAITSTLNTAFPGKK